MGAEIKIPQKRIIIRKYEYSHMYYIQHIDVLADINVYTLPDEMDSCNFQNKSLL